MTRTWTVTIHCEPISFLRNMEGKTMRVFVHAVESDTEAVSVALIRTDLQRSGTRITKIEVG